MKNIILVILFVGASSLANASETKEFDASALQLLNAVMSDCPSEMLEAMRGADRVDQASYTSDRTGVSYTIKTVAGGQPPASYGRSVATLEIIKLRVIDDTYVPDRPTQFNIKCQLSFH